MRSQNWLPDLEAGPESREDTSSIAKGDYVSIRRLNWFPEDETEGATKSRLENAVGIHKDYYGKRSR
jgi:hypothetical protein